MENNPEEIPFSWGRLILAFIIFIYLMTYSFFSIKYLFLSWSGDFSFLGRILHFNNTFTVNEEIKLAIFTTFGAILGGATLGITSLHKYAAVNKKLDIDHLWGYLMAPILSVIIGILIFCLLYSGLIILTGGSNPDTEKNSVKIGYLCMGAICSYNWDVFIKKLQQLSKHVSEG
ncbi:hypothetical protein KAG03_13265 [Klebsiella variicola]|uniref:hypothetical protein n=1 Tax=Klebsiella TaxID=570 RepID=UPI0007CD3429|nr:hypothetical protein [Klebsiella variicola]MCB7753411.1 hypothetical protein [Klebsiella variicola]PXH25345.1 hypothetical protein DMR13_25660 [Klebsiella variicola]SBH86401.1 Uncharacterised protein [Klebsiella variicola]SXD77042.1 Uncharacterised protein [Klebsiella variicola]HCI8838659.1 hypothetical protein [Klebsiella variicola]